MKGRGGAEPSVGASQMSNPVVGSIWYIASSLPSGDQSDGCLNWLRPVTRVVSGSAPFVDLTKMSNGPLRSLSKASLLPSRDQRPSALTPGPYVNRVPTP